MFRLHDSRFGHKLLHLTEFFTCSNEDSDIINLQGYNITDENTVLTYLRSNFSSQDWQSIWMYVTP